MKESGCLVCSSYNLIRSTHNLLFFSQLRTTQGRKQIASHVKEIIFLLQAIFMYRSHPNVVQPLNLLNQLCFFSTLELLEIFSAKLTRQQFKSAPCPITRTLDSITFRNLYRSPCREAFQCKICHNFAINCLPCCTQHRSCGTDVNEGD